MQSLYALKIVVSNYCLYRCKYCYVDTDDAKVIGDDRLFQAIDYYMLQAGEEKIVFFLGGESLLQFDVLQKGIERVHQKGIGKRVHIFITTSGLSLNQEKLEFLSKHDVRVGLSIDGKEDIHGLNRVSRTGKNTYGSTLAALKILNTKYDETSTGYAMTVDENTVEKTFKSFLFLSHLDIKHRNITIAGVYKNGWKPENISLLELELEKICKFIYLQIPKGNFYFYNVLSFFILELKKGNSLEKGNIEIHVFPDKQVSLYLFAQSILGNTQTDPTEARFRFVIPIAKKILEYAKTNNMYLSYLDELARRPIL